MAISRMRRRLLLHKNTASKQPNTFIGNYGNIITSATDLTSYTDLSVSDISLFSIDSDNNISCYIDVDYTIDATAFANGAKTGTGAMTYYIDLGGKVTQINNSAFNNVSEVFSLAVFPNCTTVGGSTTFASFSVGYIGDYLKICALPSCTAMGSSVLDNNIFFDNKGKLNLYVNNFLATNNGGNPDGDLSGIFNLNYSTNTTSPDAVDDLSISGYGGTAISVEWTTPTSTNTVDFYLVFVNNAYVGYTSSNSYFIKNLSLNTSYDIRVVALDEMGNISPFSNTVSQTTLSDYDVPVGNIVSYWNFDSNSNDQVGSNNGTDTSMSYVSSGGIGNVADFTAGNTSAITIPDAADLSFGNGTTDSPFSGVIRIKFNSVGNSWFLNKRRLPPNETTWEYQLIYYLGNLGLWLKDDVNGGVLLTSFAWTPVAGVWYELGWSYDGTNQPKLFLNSQQVGSANNTGTYIAMSNTVSPLIFGKASWDTVFSLNGYEDEAVIFNAEVSDVQMADIYAKHQAGQYLTE